MKKLLVLALVIRLLLIPVAFHSDLTTNSIWGIYAKEFGLRGYYDWLNFGNYARPEYPPFSTILFLLLRWIYEIIFAIFWKINLAIALFPSKIITWLDHYGYMSLLKLPGILSDIGIGYLIYRHTKKLSLMNLYLFNPAVIYLSALWGQTESFVAFFALLGIISISRKKYGRSLVSMFTSLMIKASMLPSLPIIIIQAIKNKINGKKVVILTTLLFVGLNILGQFFTDHSPFWWMVRSYKERFITGPANLPYINLNAFNFWGLILGLERIPDNTVYFGLTLSHLAWAISVLFFTLILVKFYQKGNLYFALVMIFFASFMFLPRMHERYFFPVLTFFPFLLSKFPKFTKVFYVLTFVFLVNLYHWWPVPDIVPLVAFFNIELVERSLALINLAGFGYLLWKYQLS